MKSYFVIIIACFPFFVFSQNCDSLYISSLQSFDAKEYDKSIDLVTTCIKNCPSRADYYLHAAKCYYQVDNLSKTIEYVNISLQLDSKNIPAYALKAQLQMEAELYEQATITYEKIIELYPLIDSTTLIYRINVSKAYMNCNVYEKAYSRLQEVYSLDSNNLELLTNLSVCCMKLNKQQEAEKYLYLVLQINPNYTAGLVNMGYYFIEKEEYQKAIEYFNKVLVIQPRESYALNNRGFAYFKLLKIDLALQDINQSISYDPSNAYAYRNRALVYIKSGLLQEACIDLQKALDLGFTQMYGDEVTILKKEICPSK